jgi:glycerol-3-phosphate acyltransferase PlsX
MGGDYGPEVTVPGTLAAVAAHPQLHVTLVGDRETVETELSKHAANTKYLPIAIVPAEGKIEDDEHPISALRRKPRSSIVTAMKMLRAGEADMVVSVGSTGASMATATMTLGLLEGLDRPCIGGNFLGLAPNTTVVDLGSNVDARPSLLLSFAALGVVFARRRLQIENPRVALLSVGEEAAKGNRQVQESHSLFRDSHLDFVGNVEGMDFFTNKADVIICDGFVGNILVKFTEGMGGALADFVRERLPDSVDRTVVDQLAQDLWETTNRPLTLGGGPLFGINAPVILGHGSCRANALEGAVRTAIRYVNLGLLDIMRQELAIMNNSAAEGVAKASDDGN